MKRRSIVLLTVILNLMLLAGCSKQQSENKQLTFGVVYSIVHPFFEPCTRGAEETAAKHNAKVLIAAPQNGDAGDQIRIVEDMITRGVDALAICPTHPKALEPVIARAMNEGIPVVAFGTDSPGSKRLSYIGTDQLAAAAHAADLLAALMGKKGNVVISQGLPTQEDQQQRVDGFTKRLKEAYPDMVIIDVRTGQGNAETTLANIENMLEAHSDIGGIYGTDATAGPAITTAFKNTHGKIPVVVYDDMPEILQGVRAGAITTTVVQEPYEWTVIAINTLVDALKGKKPEDPIHTGIVDVTLDNIDEIYGKKE
jgi:ribose transport system substrate-binding protein